VSAAKTPGRGKGKASAGKAPTVEHSGGGRVRFELSTPTPATARVQQIGSMFDVPLHEVASQAWDLEIPLEGRAWSVGAVLGPSGSGKSSLARHLWGGLVDVAPAWGAGALVDEFPPELGIREVTGLLTSVGLSSPPAWIRPRATLSNGEGFRADVARLLADTPPGGLAVVDEFSSVVDRQVARVASHTVQRTVRDRGLQLVAVTCHYDVEEWLQPDWVLDMASGAFRWREVQPHPPVRLHVHQVDRSLWPVFARHHYLSADLHQAAQCFGAFTDAGDPVAFASFIHFPHPKTKNVKTMHRLVTLPDWQGLGIGMELAGWLGQHLWDQRKRLHLASAHPAVIGFCGRSPRWKALGGRTALNTSGSEPQLKRRHSDARTLNVRGYEYRAPKRQDPLARASGS
jgi:energy-coupling factor transporter ATP-binding protein EcfA2